MERARAERWVFPDCPVRVSSPSAGEKRAGASPSETSSPPRRLKSVGGAGSQLAPPAADVGGSRLAAPAAGGPAGSAPPAIPAASSSGAGEKRDVSEAIDDLRSEVSRTRYEVQKLKNIKN